MTAENSPVPFGSSDLRLPDELRGPLREHLAELRRRYLARHRPRPFIGSGLHPPAGGRRKRARAAGA